LSVTAAGTTAGGTVKALVLSSSNGSSAATTYDVYGTSGNWTVGSGGLATVTGLGLTAPSTEPTISANTVDMPINSNSYFKLTASAADNLDGIVAGADGRIIVLVNEGTNNITISSDNTTETNISNRIHLAGNSGSGAYSLILAPDGILTLIYDSSYTGNSDNGAWRVLSSK
jgi:hypothetical protein